MIKSDTQLKQDIEEELRWDPRLNAAHIGVTVDQSVVSLLGSVDTYAEKWAAEEATRRVNGVRTVAQSLVVRLRGEHVRSDSELAAAVHGALEWNVSVPDTVTARVQQGKVTLEGYAEWNYQRDAAERVVRYLTGVNSVFNSIRLTPQSAVVPVKEKIEAALRRQAAEDARSIHIDLSGGKVTLSGHASSWQAIEDASRAAWAAPGVSQVVSDQVKLQPSL